MQLSFDKILLWILILLGTLLRFYAPTQIPMMNDELSALSRLQFDSFGELIEKGVKVDGHPAGIHVFLYFWTALFGENNDFVIKLPFLLMGVASLPLAYILFKRWFNSTVALFIVAYIATLQYPIMYSQIARPYISGLFFGLAMVWFWTVALFDSNKQQKWQYWTGFTFSASLCCYNHYFSLLFAFIVGCTGLFFMRRNTIKPYFISLLCIVLLFIPHLQVFLAQLKTGGLSWLSIPQNDFILNYLTYILQYNYVSYAFILTAFILGVLKPQFSKFQIIAFVWFFLPIAIGFFYSIYVKPVIQFSVLLFSFPYGLALVFSFYKEQSSFFKGIILSCIAAINIGVLVYERQHYSVFYKQYFKEFATQTQAFASQHKPKYFDIMLAGYTQYLDRYFKHYNPDLSYTSFVDWNVGRFDFRKKMATQTTPYFICGNIPLEYIPVVREYYPYLIYKDFGFIYEYYIFSKIKPKKEVHDVLFSETLDFEKPQPHWHSPPPIFYDSLRQYVSLLDSTQEWGPTFEAPLTDLSPDRHSFIDIGIDFNLLQQTNHQGCITLGIYQTNKTVLWLETPIAQYRDTASTDGWQRAYWSIRLTDSFKNQNDIHDCYIKVFFWNKAKRPIALDNFMVQTRQGNNKVYFLYEDK